MNSTFYGTASITSANRTKIQHPSIAPGPGTYQTIPKNKPAPYWSLKSKNQYGSCFQNFSIAPPPGSYDIQKSLTKPKLLQKNNTYSSIKYKSFGEKSSPMSLLNMPSSLNTKSGFLFGSREEVIVKQLSPGPIYDINKNISQERLNKKKNTCRGFGFGDRNGIYKKDQQTPGPGSYNSQSNLHFSKTTWSFSKDKKPNLSKISDEDKSIGPGQYNPKLLQNSKSCKIKGKYPEVKRQVFNTGPGAYQLPDTKSKIGVRFNSKQHSNQKKNYQSPSPCEYSPKRYPQTIPNQAGFSLGCGIRDKDMNGSLQIPGPGTYQVEKDLSKKQAGGYIGQKIKTKKKNQTDNFYKYNPNLNAISKQSPKFSFGGSLYGRDQQQNQDKINSTLGPGQYNLKLSKGQMHSFSKDQRWKQPQIPLFYDKKNKDVLYSTIGFMPSYLKKNSSMIGTKLMNA